MQNLNRYTQDISKQMALLVDPFIKYVTFELILTLFWWWDCILKWHTDYKGQNWCKKNWRKNQQTFFSDLKIHIWMQQNYIFHDKLAQGFERYGTRERHKWASGEEGCEKPIFLVWHTFKILPSLLRGAIPQILPER